MTPANLGRVARAAGGLAIFSCLLAGARVFAAPAISQQPLNLTVEIGAGGSLTVQASGVQTLGYQWYRNGTILPGQTYSSIQFYALEPGDDGSYTVAVTDANGTTTSSAATVAASPDPSPTSEPLLTAPNTQYEGLGGSLVFDGYSPFGSSLVSTQWLNNGQPVSTDNPSFFELDSLQYPNAGTYVELLGNSSAQVASTPTQVVVTQPTPTNIWTGVTSQGGIVYFAFGPAQQLLRYDMGAGAWMPAVSTPDAPTAVCALPEGVYVAFGRVTDLYTLDLSSSQPITNTSAEVSQIFANATYAYLYGLPDSGPNEPTIVSVNRSTKAVAQSTTFAGLVSGIAATADNTAYGWGESEPSTLEQLPLNSDGSIANVVYRNVSKESPDLSQVEVSPDGSSVFVNSGGVYDGATEDFEGSLGTLYDDVCFLADGSPVVLRGNGITLYSTSRVIEGRVTLPSVGQRVFADGSTVYVFSAPSSPGGQPGVTAVTEAQLIAAPPQPFPQLSSSASAGIGTVPDGGFVGTDGILYLLSRPTGNLLRWSSSQNAYLASIPLSGIPFAVSYSASLNRVYVLYGDHRVTQINLAVSTAEEPFVVLEGDSIGIIAADSQLYAISNMGFGEVAELYNSSGSRTAAQYDDFTGYFGIWISATQQLALASGPGFFVGSLSGGTIGTFQNYDYNLNPTPTAPLWLSADGTLLGTGGGLVLSTSGFGQVGVLSTSPVDAAWSGSTLYPLSSVNGSSQVDECPSSGSYISTKHISLPGLPFRIWALPGGDFAVLTGTGSGPVITTIDGSLNVVQTQSNSAPWFGPPEITTEPVGAIVQGGNVTLSVTAVGSGLTYSWRNGFSQTLGTGSSLTLSGVTQDQAGSYYVVVSGDGQNVSSDQVSILIAGPPSFEGAPIGQSVTLGESFTLDAGATSTPAPTYQWYLNGVAIPGATGASYAVGSAQASDGGTYTLVASNTYGNTTSQPAVITVSSSPQAPAITVQPASQSVDSGVNVTLSVTATGSPAPSYQWYFNGSPISGQTSSSISLGSVVPSSSGTYTVSATNSSGSVTSSGATLAVSSVTAPSIATQPLSQGVAPGAGATFTVSATGTGPLTYQWSFNNTPIAGAVSDSFSVVGAQASSSGSYTVTVSGPDTSVVSQGAVLTVAGSSGAPSIGTQPQPQVIQAGSTVTFSVTSGGSITTSSVAARISGATTYQWLRNNVAINGASEPTLLLRNATAADDGSYSCLLTNSSGATLSGSADLTVANSSAPGRLIDISCRALVGTGGNILIAGFTVGGGTSAALPVLVRSSGPALAEFNVSGLLQDPTLELYSGSNTAEPLETNSGWSGDTIISSAAARVGAFAWTSASSHDSAIVQSLGPGGYTAQTLGASSDTGVALAEVYDATPAGSYAPGTSQRLTNISARVQVGTGSGVLIAGFVIGGSTSETVLIRASGPALTKFGVTGVIPDPQLTLNGGSSGTSVLATSQGWNGDPQSAAVSASVGAFAWPSTSSNDSLLLVTLPPGAYTAEVSGASGDTGIALIEVYEVP